MTADANAAVDTKPATTPAATPAAAPAHGQDAAPNAGSSHEPSILDDTTDGNVNPDTPAAHPATWPENWREEWAGGDDKRLAELKRFKSPADLPKSYWALRQKLSTEYVKKPPPADATEEQKAAYRAEIGVPKDPSEYKLPEIKGHEWTEADKPIVDSFLGALHSADVPQPVVDAALGWYADFQAQQQETMIEADKLSKQETEDVLRSEFGNEYRPSINLVSRLLKDTEVFPGEVGTMLATARTPDGRRLINNPDLIRYLVGAAREKYGEASMISGNEARTLANEEEEARNIMKTDIDRYYKEGWNKKLEAIMTRKAGGKGQPSHYSD
jgi:hypothetical protein